MSAETPLELAAPRYASTPFPPYRFRPGRHPHPTAHPEGHSYHPPGHPPPAVDFRGLQEWRDSEDYLSGCDLYNHGYWWEAHEAWEGLWQLTDKAALQGQFLQTLIQVAACHLKLAQARLDGVRSLRRSSRGHFEQVRALAPGPVVMGLPVVGWFSDVDAYYEACLARPAPLHDAARYPYIVLT